MALNPYSSIYSSIVFKVLAESLGSVFLAMSVLLFIKFSNLAVVISTASDNSSI
jgi:hypothetical protein